MIYSFLISPFIEHAFMRHALAGCFALAIGAAPLGVFLVLRRMALMGDAMQHAILPGVTVAYLMAGLSLWPMTLGGLAAGIIVAMAAGFITRSTALKEDASFTGMYMISLALGVVLASSKGDAHELLHMLFGDVQAISDEALMLICTVTSISIVAYALIYRPLVLECFDPRFMKAVNGRGALVYHVFLLLVVMNLVVAFHAMGTLMALGLMVMPAISARLWAHDIDRMVYFSILFGILTSIAGLLLSYHYQLPSGASIVLAGGVFYLLSVVIGPSGGLLIRLLPSKHLKG